jgi:hypothetical protein
MRANRFQTTIGPPPGVIDARFGSVIAARFLRGGLARPLAAVVQRHTPAVAGASIHTSNLQVSPRVFLQLAIQARVETHAPAGPVVFPSEGRLHALLEHMFARNYRSPSLFSPSGPSKIDRDSPPHAFAAPPTVAPVSAAPVPRVLKREFQPPAPPVWETPRSFSTAAIEPPPSAHRTAAPAPIPPAEVNRLTTEVLRAIDRRVVAERERRGKR